MLLFIDADNNKQTGWQGYDYVVNTEVKNSGTTTIKKWVKGSWTSPSPVSYKTTGNEMELSIPLSLLRTSGFPLNFNFHWVDNIQKLDDITEFFIHGDSAPERRFDYHYTTSKQ